MYNYLLWILTKEPAGQINLFSSCQFWWWIITASTHYDDAAHILYTANIIALLIIHEQVYDCVASTNLPLLLQKLEEFLFCMEDNHPEVGNANSVTVWLNCVWADRDSKNPLDDLYLNMTSVPFLTVGSILICMRCTARWCRRSEFAQNLLKPSFIRELNLICQYC